MNIKELTQLPENSTVLLPYSGGADSLALLLLLLANGNRVYTLYVIASQHPTKVKAEQEVRRKILSNIRLSNIKTKGMLMDDVVINTCNTTLTCWSGGISKPAEYNGLLVQPFDWIYGIGLAARCFEVDFDYIGIAWIKGDSSNLFISEFISALENMVLLSIRWSNKTPKIIFPLITEEKSFVYKTITTGIPIYKGIDCFWTCELPLQKGDKIIPCGGCPACLNLKKTLLGSSDHIACTPIEDIISHFDGGSSKLNERMFNILPFNEDMEKEE